MARYVPIVAVVPQGVADRLAVWASEAPPLEQHPEVAELLERNGWTTEMLLAGVLLAEGLGAATARPFG